MLPILRIISVGGVSIASLILLLVLIPLEVIHPPLRAITGSASGTLIARDGYPERRQFLIKAALRRADQSKRLRLLPDTPLPDEASVPVKSKDDSIEPKAELAALPIQQIAADGQDAAGSTVRLSDSSIPLGIGESSASELPVIPRSEWLPVIVMPAHNEPQKPFVIPPQAPGRIEPARSKFSLTVVPAKPVHAVINVTAMPATAMSIHGSRRRRTHISSSRLTRGHAKPADFNPLVALFGIDTRQPAIKRKH